MEERNVTIELTEENAIRLEKFLQTILPTYKFQGLEAALYMKACDNLYKKLRIALDAIQSK